jgi:ATP-dependent Lon protease
VLEGTARTILGEIAQQILKEFPGEDVRIFLSEVVDHVAENALTGKSEDDPIDLYGVNVLIEHDPDPACPIVVENTPTLANLLGSVDREWGPRGAVRSDYRMIRTGSLLRADGGYLILDVREVLTEPGAWRVLLRTLRTGVLEIVPPEMTWLIMAPSLKPEPIPVSVKVILIGDSMLYYLLDRHDPDFAQLFKVLADFDSVIDREPEGVRQYAGVMARIAEEENLRPFSREAVAALAEHGARIASHGGKLTARFGRVADIAREASFLAKEAEAGRVEAAHVEEAVLRTKRRADLPSRRFRELMANGTIQVQTSGEVVGQINGLAVISAGPLTYGFPARITASIGAGSAGLVDIEAQAQLSGAIHTKGFNILGGLLRCLLQTDHPLAFSASLAFEQSYGGIDGDSASGAEICCLLSALTNIPIRQSIAMTGAIDQKGHIQAIGGVNEKIEGFFDTCKDIGLTGDQGVIIPASNANELMLRDDVIEACRAGKFHVWAVSRVHEALEILTGVAAGERDEDGEYPEDSLLGIAVAKAAEYWVRSAARPVFRSITGEDEEGAEEEPGPPPGSTVAP